MNKIDRYEMNKRIQMTHNIMLVQKLWTCQMVCQKMDYFLKVWNMAEMHDGHYLKPLIFNIHAVRQMIIIGFNFLQNWTEV